MGSVGGYGYNNCGPEPVARYGCSNGFVLIVILFILLIIIGAAAYC